MKGKVGAIGFSVVLLLGIAVMPVWADSISPTSVTGTINVGGSITVSKTVTVSAGTPTAAQGDVFFLSDTTGSMGGTIDNVKTNAAAILTGLSGYGNISTGAGSYKDFYTGYETKGWGSPGDYAYKLDSAINGSASTSAGIGTWTASGGNDYYEAQLYALQQVATTATGWRAGSERFVIWFGDAPGHEPSNTTDYPGPSTADTLAALKAAGITVFAYDVGEMNGEGQVSAITSGTGGKMYTSLGSGDDVVDAILAAITLGFSEYSTVGIEAPSLAGLGISIFPTFYSGDFDRSVQRTFGFDVTFTGLAPGTYDFSLYGTVDGGRIATETDHIVVTGTAVPEPGTLLLMGLGLLGLVAGRKKLS